MKVHFACGYYSDLAHKLKRRPEPYWEAYSYVWAVKSGMHKKNFMLPTLNGRIQITEKNFALVRDFFGRFIVQTMHDEQLPADALLIPIPSKDGLVWTWPNSYRTLDMLNESLKDKQHPGLIFDGLRWIKELPKSHAGGNRDRAFLASQMHLHEEAIGRKIVLIDDVLSTGSTMLAAKDVLESRGATVLFAITCGRTIYDFNTKPFERQVYELKSEIHDYPQGAP